jgi:protein lifeguard
VHNHHHN